MLRLDEIAELFLEFPIIKAEFSNGDATREIDSIQPKFQILVSVFLDNNFLCMSYLLHPLQIGFEDKLQKELDRISTIQLKNVYFLTL